MPPNTEILKRKLKRLQAVPDTFLGRLKAIQREQFTLVVSKLKRLDLVSNSIAASRKNFLLIDTLREDLYHELLRSEYVDVVKDFATEFDKQKALNEDYYDTTSVNGDASVSAIKRQTVEALITDSVKSNYLTPLESVLNNAVSSNAGFDETLKIIQLFIEGSDEVDGSIQRYSKQIAHDSFANSDRAYSNIVSDELGFEFYLYAGTEVPTTRCFCDERHGKFYHWKEIAAWGRGDNVGDCGFPWQGMNRATNEDTIFNYAGGYNCLHTIAGVSIFDTPADVVRRNVENGNYEPSEYESKVFNLA